MHDGIACCQYIYERWSEKISYQVPKRSHLKVQPTTVRKIWEEKKTTNERTKKEREREGESGGKAFMFYTKTREKQEEKVETE